MMPSNTITIVQQNTRKSITAVNEIKQKMTKLRPDLLLIQEPYVLCREVIFDLNSRLFHFDAAQNNRHINTVIICLNNYLNIQLIDDFSNDFCTTVGVSCHGKAIIVANFYIPPNQLNDSHINFLTNLSSTFSSHPLVVCGDFNSRSPVWHDNKTNQNGARFKGIFNQTDLVLQNDKSHTCFTHNGSSLIDLTMTNSHATGSILRWRVECLSTITDHRAIHFQIDLRNNLPVIDKRLSNWAFSEKNADWEDFSTNFQNRFCNIELADEESEAAIDENIKAFSELLVESAYSTLRCNKKSTPSRNTVWSKEVELLQIHFRHLRNLYFRGKASKLMYNAARNKYIRAYRKLRKTVFVKFAEQNNSSDPYGNTFRLMEKRLATAPKDIPFINALDGPKQTLQMQHLLGKLFPDDDASTDSVEVNLLRSYSPVASNNVSVSFQEQEVWQVIEGLRPKKSPGVDKISNRMIKATLPCSCEFLTETFNRCLRLGYFPSSWKMARVQILPKPNKSDYSITKSYRPIALTTHLSKVFEKLIRNHLQEALTLNERQHGFVKGKSTISALKAITDLIIEKKATHKVAVIAIDISGAFDNAFWPAIIKQLDSQNVPASLISITQSYLDGRKVVFDYQGRSVSKVLTKGTPQGGVLSPLLWNIILNELLTDFHQPDCELIAYADDVTIICWNREECHLRESIRSALLVIDNWCKARKLTFSTEKTNLLYVHCKDKLPINCSEEVITPVENIKILGVTFGDHRLRSKLNFHPHVLDVVARATRTKNALFALAKKSWGINSRKRLILYKTVVRPMISYAAEIWFPHLNGSSKKKLDAMQYCFLRHAIQAFSTVSYNVTHAMADLPVLSTFLTMKFNREPTEAYRMLTRRYISESNEIFRDFFPDGIPKYVKPNFFNMQFFSGHGHFNQFLERINAREDGSCSCGQGPQDAKHLLLHCGKTQTLRQPLLQTVTDLNGFIDNQSRFLLFNDLCRTIHEQIVTERALSH